MQIQMQMQIQMKIQNIEPWHPSSTQRIDYSRAGGYCCESAAYCETKWEEPRNLSSPFVRILYCKKYFLCELFECGHYSAAQFGGSVYTHCLSICLPLLPSPKQISPSFVAEVSHTIGRGICLINCWLPSKSLTLLLQTPTMQRLATQQGKAFCLVPSWELIKRLLQTCNFSFVARP